MLTVLVCMALAGLVIAATVGFVDTSLRAKIESSRHTKGVYAAEAGIEDVLSCLKLGLTPRTVLPQSLNSNNVSMQTQNLGERTFYAGEWVLAGSEHDWLLISSNITWDNGFGAYRLTINVTYNAPSQTNIHLLEVGVQLPPGYSYVTGSAALFAGNLSLGGPQTNNTSGIWRLNWVFPSPRPSVSDDEPVRTQSFYITGTGSLDGHYAWVVAARQDIGYVSELVGVYYKITATARSQDNNQVSGRIEADVIISQANIYILSWRIYSG